MTFLLSAVPVFSFLLISFDNDHFRFILSLHNAAENLFVLYLSVKACISGFLHFFKKLISIIHIQNYSMEILHPPVIHKFIA